MCIMKTLDIIDSHTGGEPTRLVVSGGPALGGGTLAQRLDVFRTHFDDWRAGVVTDPRGSDVVGGALLDRSYTVNTSQLSLLVPALNYSSANPRNTAFTIRGLGSSVEYQRQECHTS